jgi:hypothetical protein
MRPAAAPIGVPPSADLPAAAPGVQHPVQTQHGEGVAAASLGVVAARDAEEELGRVWGELVSHSTGFQSVPLRGSTVMIGRKKKKVQVWLDNSKVSSRHAVLHLQQQGGEVSTASCGHLLLRPAHSTSLLL